VTFFEDFHADLARCILAALDPREEAAGSAKHRGGDVFPSRMSVLLGPSRGGSMDRFLDVVKRAILECDHDGWNARLVSDEGPASSKSDSSSPAPGIAPDCCK